MLATMGGLPAADPLAPGARRSWFAPGVGAQEAADGVGPDRGEDRHQQQREQPGCAGVLDHDAISRVTDSWARLAVEGWSEVRIQDSGLLTRVNTCGLAQHELGPGEPGTQQ